MFIFTKKTWDCEGNINILCDIGDLFVIFSLIILSLLISNPENLATGGSIYKKLFPTTSVNSSIKVLQLRFITSWSYVIFVCNFL